MKKEIKRILFLLLFCFVMFSCASSVKALEPRTEIIKTITKTETIHDTVLKTTLDSTSYKALLECQNGKVIISQKAKISIKKGRFLAPPKIKIQDNILTVDCQAKAQELFFKWKTSYTKEHLIKNTIKPYLKTQYVEKKLSYWQTSCLFMGRLFFAIISIGLLFAILRWKKII